MKIKTGDIQMKKVKLLFIGAISLVVFGLLLPQPIQALLVIIDTPVKNFFVTHALSLCVVVGLIQGISEEKNIIFGIEYSIARNAKWCVVCI